jgi:hypothetical protein
MREVVERMYVLSTGGQWRAIPKDLPPRSTVYEYFGLVDLGPHARPHSPRALCNLPETGGREASPTGSIIDMPRGPKPAHFCAPRVAD